MSEDEMVRNFTVLGTVEKCIDRIERYWKAGLNHLIVFNADLDIYRSLDYYK